MAARYTVTTARGELSLNCPAAIVDAMIERTRAGRVHVWRSGRGSCKWTEQSRSAQRSQHRPHVVPHSANMAPLLLLVPNRMKRGLDEKRSAQTFNSIHMPLRPVKITSFVQLFCRHGCPDRRNRSTPVHGQRRQRMIEHRGYARLTTRKLNLISMTL